jgi:hypothetical protein
MEIDMKALYIVIVLAGAFLLLAACTTDHPQPPTADEIKAYREWKEKNDSDEFFGRPIGPKIGPFTFGKKAKRNPVNYEDD